MKLKCFVAMAFGEKDTDQLYKSQIKPILKANNLLPIRIDELNHNDEINLKLIDEMNECAFGVADLTYARPSVYYEAGYINATKKVIYTCRSDHFFERHRKKEPPESHLIHFDLKMKNIVKWTNPNFDHIFKTNFQKRIKVHFGPRISNHAKENKTKELEILFAKKSLSERIKTVALSGMSFIKRNKYKFDKESTNSSLSGEKEGGKVEKSIRIRTYEAITVRDLRSLFNGFNLYKSDRNLDRKKSHEIIVAVLSFNKISRQRIVQTFRNYSPISDRIYFSQKITNPNRNIGYRVYFFFYDGVKSEDVYNDLQDHLSSLHRSPSNQI